LYAKQQRYFIIETEVAAGENGSTRPLAKVSVGYRNLKTETTDKLTSAVQVKFSDSDDKIAEDRDVETYAYCTLQVTNERNRQATALRDAGQVGEAKKLLELNVKVLRDCEDTCRINGVVKILPELKKIQVGNSAQAEMIADDKQWNYSRKGMRAMQNMVEQQQTYEGSSSYGSRSQKVAPSASQSSSSKRSR